MADLDDKLFNIKIKRSDLSTFKGSEIRLFSRLKGDDKKIFMQLMACLDLSEVEKYFRSDKEVIKKTDNVISYFGANEKNEIKNFEEEISIAIFNYNMQFVDIKKPNKRYCINFCYKKLQTLNISHYKSAALAYAIAYEFGFKTKTEIKFPFERGKNQTQQLYKLAVKVIPKQKA